MIYSSYTISHLSGTETNSDEDESSERFIDWLFVNGEKVTLRAENSGVFLKTHFYSSHLNLFFGY